MTAIPVLPLSVWFLTGSQELVSRSQGFRVQCVNLNPLSRQ